MAADDTPRESGGGVLAGLLAPLRLPQRVIDALDSLVEATRELVPMRSELTRVREQTEPLADLLPALERLEERLGSRLDSVHEIVKALESEESYLNTAVKGLRGELEAMHKILAELQDDVKDVTEQLPDSNRGPLQKARDVLTGDDNRPSS